MSWLTDIGRGVAAVSTLGQSELAIKGYEYLTKPPDTMNSRGDALSDADKALLASFGPVQSAEMLSNWLTAGGPPGPVDPSKIFGDAQNVAGVKLRASAGQGVAGLFGFGKSIGEMQPDVQIGSAPLAPGVAYSAKPVPRPNPPGLFR